MNLKKNKKAMELSLNMIIIMILGIIVLVLMIYFFGGHFSEGSTQLENISGSVLDQYKLP